MGRRRTSGLVDRLAVEETLQRPQQDDDAAAEASGGQLTAGHELVGEAP